VRLRQDPQASRVAFAQTKNIENNPMQSLAGAVGGRTAFGQHLTSRQNQRALLIIDTIRQTPVAGFLRGSHAPPWQAWSIHRLPDPQETAEVNATNSRFDRCLTTLRSPCQRERNAHSKHDRPWQRLRQTRRGMD